MPAADAKVEGREHPILTWRKQVLARDDAKTFEHLATRTKADETTKVGAKGTPAQNAAELADTFVKESDDYWNGNSSHERYFGSIDAFLESAAKHEVEAQKESAPYVAPPLMDEASFDRTFVHAAGFYQLTLVDSRLAERRALLPYWSLGFDFPTHAGEDDDPDAYISRICYADEAIKERCKGIPHEFRAAVLDRAYLELIKKQAEQFKPGSEEGKVFGDVMARFVADLTAATKDELAIVENPVLPATFAKPGGTSGLISYFLPEKGIFLADEQLAESFDGSIPKDFSAKALEVLNKIKNTPGNIINYTRAVVEAPGSMSTAAMRDIVSAFRFEDGVVKNVVFVGRRHADDSLRKGVLNLQMMHVDAPKNSSYQFPEDAQKTTCALMGFMGEALLGNKKEFYLELSPTRFRAVAVHYDKEAKEWKKDGETLDLGSPSNIDALEEWLDKTEGQVQIFLSTKFSYNDAMELLSRVLSNCKDTQITFRDPNKAPLTRACGASVDRHVSVVLSICGD
ncbi:MAG: hypothetical protein EP329_25300 [Deltaproteobacteria bacterium]|nr:MAG: hypothetical protein EP329_25300 [Deltaproteobacteria bacterium]